MSSREALNLPTDVRLGNDEFAVREVPLMKIKAIVEKYILDGKVRKIQMLAALLEGDQQRKFVEEQGDKLPEGGELEGMAIALLSSGNMPDACAIKIIHDGMITDAPDTTEADVAQAFTDATQAQATLMIKIVTGSKKGQTPARRNSAKSRKSTTGRQK